MRRRAVVPVALAFLARAEDWPQFRGPAGNGVSPETGVPLTWNERENVRWKVAPPGKGWSSPIIAGNEIWLTAAADDSRSLRALLFDTASGALRKNIELFRLETPVAGHAKNSGASPSVIIAGDRVFAHFGSYGTACFGRDGSVLWRNQELKFKQVHGPGGSPVLYEDLLIVNCDGHDVQFVAGLDIKTGTIAWRTPRPSAMAYATPLVIPARSGPQVVSPGAHRAVSYDPRTGEELWSVRYGDGFSNVPRPVFGHGLVYLCTGFYQPELLAVRVDGRGDVTTSHVVWRYSRGVPLTPSPLLSGDEIYIVSDNGILTCLDAKSGREHWRQRLGGNFSASPVLAEGRIYVLSEGGETTVLAAGTKFQKLATNHLDGSFLASMAVSGGAFFLRSDTHLYRIGKS